MKRGWKNIMNIAFLLTPKNEVIYEYLDSTMRQAVERMDHHGYTAIPLIDRSGRYVGTLTEGDLLWKLKQTPNLDFKNTENVKVNEITKKTKHKSVSINANVEDIINLATAQNFVPVVDDDGIFIGIIKRGDIINYCYNLIRKGQKFA